MTRNLNIFIPHCSGLLTDHLPHGDGLVAHGFISKLAQRGHNLWVAAEQVDLAKPLGQNVRLFPIRSNRKNGMVARLDYMRQVRQLFHRLQREIAFDLIHQLNPVYTGMSLALWDAKVPVVLGPYVADWPVDPDSTSPLGLLGQIVEKSIAWAQQRNAQTLLLTTEAARNRIISSHRAASHSSLLPHGIDEVFFRPASAEHANEAAEHQRILFLANITVRKGIFDLLQAFEIVHSRFPAAELLLAGAGDDLERCKTAAASLSSSKQISFLGYTTRAQTVPLFHRSSLCCMPSHGEPFGMTVVEAMSCGLPVIVTNAGGVAHLVDSFGGLRVPVGSPQALADALTDLLAHPARRAEMGKHNRAKVLNTMTWDRVIDRLEEIYFTNIETTRLQPSAPPFIRPSSMEDFS